MNGFSVARILLLFSCFDPIQNQDVDCALVRWYSHPNDLPARDTDTGMWQVIPESNELDFGYPVQVISLSSIARGIHLLPCYGSGFLPVDFPFTRALDAFETYHVNHFIDYHAHELLS